MRTLAVLVLVLAACAPAPRLTGTDLGKTAAPDFTLVDGPTGRTVTLSALRGRAVALAFLYTSCPDVCPLTAEKFRGARDALGADAAKVSFVAVSVDPLRDTPSATRRFLDDHRMSGSMAFLIGDRASLERVWSAYAIAAQPNGEVVEHNDAVYLIDAQGRERALVHSDVDVDALATDLRALAREGGPL